MFELADQRPPHWPSLEIPPRPGDELNCSQQSGYTIIERLSLTLRQTANGKNETVAVCPRASVFSSLDSRKKIFVFVVNSRRHFSVFM